MKSPWLATCIVAAAACLWAAQAQADEVVDKAPVPAAIAEAPPAAKKTQARGPEVDAAIARLRGLGVFVREFHPRNNPQYWVQIIVPANMGEAARKNAENFDDEAVSDVEIIGRGVDVQLHLRNTSITSAGVQGLASAGNISRLELSGRNVDNAILKSLAKLPLQGSLGIESNTLTDEDIAPLAECRQLVSISVSGRLLTDDCLVHLIGLPNLEGVSLGKNFTPEAFEILARLEDLKDLEVFLAGRPQTRRLQEVSQASRRLSLLGEGTRTMKHAGHNREFIQGFGAGLSSRHVDHQCRRAASFPIGKAGRHSLWMWAPLDDDVAASSIRKMKQLKWLSLGGCAIGDATIAAVAECTELRFLSLSNTLVSDAGLAELIKLKKLHALYLSSCKFVTDDGVKSLMQLPASEEHSLQLNVQSSGITEQAARRLHRALPHAQIVWGVPAVPLR